MRPPAEYRKIWSVKGGKNPHGAAVSSVRPSDHIHKISFEVNVVFRNAQKFEPHVFQGKGERRNGYVGKDLRTCLREYSVFCDTERVHRVGKAHDAVHVQNHALSASLLQLLGRQFF